MAKGQKRSTREIKKPKASKVAVASPSSILQPRPEKSSGKGSDK